MISERIKLLPAALLVALLVTTASGADRDRPNIVFFFIDDMGYADPGCFGNPVMKTPHIDRLAAEGIRLTNFYSNSPICSPSRVAVTTGQYPARWKIHSYLNTRAGNARRGMRDFLDAAAPTTAKKLQAAGYATAHFGKWHMGGGRDVDDAPLPTEYGFDESWVAFEGLGDRLLTNPKNSSVKLGRGKIEFCHRSVKTERYTDRAIDFIRRNRERPFFVRLFPNDVHDPHVPAEGAEEKWKVASESNYDRKFFAVLEEMDRQIGRLVDEVDKLGLTEKTLFVFTSDNGPTDWPKYYNEVPAPPGFTGPLFGRKWSLFEGGIRMPFIARWVGKIPKGIADESSVVAAIDLSPTFCALAGVDIPAEEKLDGFDVSGVLLGKKAERPAPIYWQYGSPHAVLKAGKAEYQSPSFAVRDGRWKFLVNPDGSEARLFDIESDPGEGTNLLEKEPERAKALAGKVAGWAHGLDFAFDADAELRPPKPGIAASFNGQLYRFANHGVEVGEDGSWQFDGESSLDLPRQNVPLLGGNRWIRVKVNIEAKSEAGVIVAHGGDRWGYSLYLKEGKLHFATCADWKRTVATAPDVLGDGAHDVEIFWGNDGKMDLRIDGEFAAKAKAPSPMLVMPGDSIQIGADLIKPAGDYEVPHRFRGTLRAFDAKYAQ